MPTLPPQKIQCAKWHKPLYVLGNTALLSRSLTGFLCSQEYPAKAVLPIYRWAKTACDNNDTIISSFHAPLEEDVREILLTRNHPHIWVYPRALPKRMKNPSIKTALANDELLILSPISQTQKQASHQLTKTRSKCVIALAHKTIIGYAAPTSTLTPLLTPTCHPLKL